KFLFHAPSDLHRDWARAGVNRAVIDKRAESDGLWSLLKNTLLPKPVQTTFLYPPTGVGQFCEQLADGTQPHGRRIKLGCRVEALDTRKQRVVGMIAGSEPMPCENVVWTAPITLANRLLGIPSIDLEYLSTIFYNLEIAAPATQDYQWTYYGGDE